ncbi:unnamed protein product [Symbiodinium natans]|uniref:Uncharacterized protein n=1 Tax=Symbiodinium natans TaxID=878477 RepID=A0A812UGJ2_9DINO|nr:unnamed protein product [Symbiodinium natans]
MGGCHHHLRCQPAQLLARRPPQSGFSCHLSVEHVLLRGVIESCRMHLYASIIIYLQCKAQAMQVDDSIDGTESRPNEACANSFEHIVLSHHIASHMLLRSAFGRHRRAHLPREHRRRCASPRSWAITGSRTLGRHRCHCNSLARPVLLGRLNKDEEVCRASDSSSIGSFQAPWRCSPRTGTAAADACPGSESCAVLSLEPPDSPGSRAPRGVGKRNPETGSTPKL